MSLTPKQQRFVEEYLVTLNATQAAIDAGYSKKTAKEIGYENLTKPHIAEAIQSAMDERSERTKITADRVLLEYARLGFSDMREFAVWGPNGVKWIESESLSEDAAACVAEVSETVSEGGRTRRFKLHSKTAALKDLAQHLQLLGKEGSGVTVNIDNRQEKPDYSNFTEEELRAHRDYLAKLRDNGRGRERLLPHRN